jgi:hypothetical protein
VTHRCVTPERGREHAGTADHVLEDVAHGELGARRLGAQVVLAEAVDEAREEGQDLVELLGRVHGSSSLDRWREPVHRQLSSFSIAPVADEPVQLVVPRELLADALGHAAMVRQRLPAPHRPPAPPPRPAAWSI